MPLEAEVRGRALEKAHLPRKFSIVQFIIGNAMGDATIDFDITRFSANP